MIVVFRDAERGSRVSIAATSNLFRRGHWQIEDLTDFPVGAWEPTYDTELWKHEGRLQLFVQRTGQGDGERLEEVVAQEVVVLEVGIQE